jgi:hypothetical protein
MPCTSESAQQRISPPIVGQPKGFCLDREIFTVEKFRTIEAGNLIEDEG